MLKTCRISFFVAAALVSFVSCPAQNTPVKLGSPDGQIVVHFTTQPQESSESGGGKLVYSVDFHGKPVLAESGLSLELDDQPALGSDVKITGADAGQGVDDYALQNQKVSK